MGLAGPMHGVLGEPRRTKLPLKGLMALYLNGMMVSCYMVCGPKFMVRFVLEVGAFAAAAMR